jgi:hypothetical protein
MRTVIIGVLLVAAAGPARADSLSRLGLGVSLGGGVEGFTDGRLADTAGTGAAWDLRLLLGTHTSIALEAAYDGSAQTVSAFGLDPAAILIGTGLEGGVRFNVWSLPFMAPYVAAGAGWRRYDLTRASLNHSVVSEHDNVLELPLAAGLAIHIGGTTLDARVQYRVASGSDLVRDDNGRHLAMNRWGVSANLGVEL